MFYIFTIFFLLLLLCSKCVGRSTPRASVRSACRWTSIEVSYFLYLRKCQPFSLIKLSVHSVMKGFSSHIRLLLWLTEKIQQGLLTTAAEAAASSTGSNMLCAHFYSQVPTYVERNVEQKYKILYIFFASPKDRLSLGQVTRDTIHQINSRGN